jgi:hypothetical protein
MADMKPTKEAELSEQRLLDENKKLIQQLSSLNALYTRAAVQQKLLLPRRLLEYKAVNTQIALMQAQINNDKALLALTKQRISSAQGEINYRQDLQKALSKELEDKQRRLSSNTADLQNALTANTANSEYNAQLDIASSALAELSEKLKQQIVAKEQEIIDAQLSNNQEKQKKEEALRVQQGVIQSKIAELQESRRNKASEKSGGEIKQDIESLRQQEASLTAELQKLQASVGVSTNTQNRLNEQQSELLKLQETLANVEKQKLTLPNEMASLSKDIESSRQYISELNSEQQTLTGEVEKLQSELQKNQSEIKNSTDEMTTLRSEASVLADNITKKVKEMKQLPLEFAGKAFKEVGDSLIALRDNIYGIQKELGTTFGTAINVAAGALVNRVTSFFSGGPILSFQETIDTVNAFQQEFGGILTRGEAQRIAQASKTLGVSAQVFAQAQRSFLTAGGDATKTSFITQFRAAGLTASQALKFAADNANLVAIAGVKYADALARAAANAQRIGVGLDKTEALADGIVGDFEGALERFSELRAMGVEVDFNRLAAVAGTGTPEEVQKELSSQLGGNQNLLGELQRNRFLKVALERDLGLNVAEIQRLAAGEGAKATEATQEEKDRTTRDKILERVGTVISSIGTLIGGIATLSAITVSNTLATNANTIALGGKGLGGMLGLGKPALSGMGALGKLGMVGGGAALGMGGVTAGANLVKQGNTGFGVGLGALGGGLGLALALAPFTGGASLLAAGLLGAGLGGAAAYGIGKSMAYGGLITGPGTPTSDNILTPTSPGEFVVNATATKTYGMDMLNNINKGSFTPTTPPAVNNVVNVNMERLESKFDKLASALTRMKIEIDGNTVGRVSLNARSPLDRLSVVG